MLIHRCARAFRKNQKGTMSNYRLLLATVCGLALMAPPLFAQTSPNKDIKILEGPATAPLGKVAQVKVPPGYSFLDGKTTQRLMEASGEPTSGRELGLLMPTNEDWSVIFEFNDIGYVKDDDKDKLDADKLLKTITEDNNEANKQREQAGHPPLIIVGWEQPPKYDETTHNLEWAIRATSGNEAILNYNTRLLGRKGVMEAVLIVAPDELPATLPKFRKLLADYNFATGESYAEYRPGDKVAKYGLAALVLGGAAVGAAKLGLLGPLLLFLKKAWYLVVAAFAAVAGFFKKLFARVTGRRSGTT